jgi:hypothetical protein
MADRIACPNQCGRLKPPFAIRNGMCDSCEAEAVQAQAGPPEKTWDDIKGQRNILLERSDATQAPDRPMDEQLRDDWKTYRQALRDIPQVFAATGPESVIWPTAPA